MRIVFKRLIIHNFLSYGDAEIDLRDKGYCLVSGINNCPKDNALSNGSGKSSWTSAICWALTGETIQGNTQNIKNINIDEPSCYVTLEFNVNNDEYVVTRYKEPKPDMKITVNGENKSGKGIKESTQALNELLPDLTSNLIASIIILGQGLPFKFSNNTPSGRKEVLEKLSKSDFMIQDLKNRLNDRSAVLEEKKRKYEDAILAAQSKKSLLEEQLKASNEKLTELNKPHNFDEEIEKLKTNISEIETLVKARKNTLNEEVTKVNKLNESLNKILTEKSGKLDAESAEFNEFNSEYLNRKYKLEADIRTLEAEIKKLKAITDICPTCGQKIPGAKKPDTTQQETTLETNKKALEELNGKYKTVHESYLKNIENINNSYKKSIDDFNTDINTKRTANNTEDAAIRQKETETNNLKVKLNTIETEKKNHANQVKETEDLIKTQTEQIDNLKIAIKANDDAKEDTLNHLSVISQMMTLVKRDFRGILLANVINYIDMKAKEYAREIFGCDELEFKLDGNDIDIVYCNKIFESLSGGEKQKVDLIIQFAIRDMMSKYLDFSSNILILDEITDNLDAIGCNNVLNLISTKLNDIESIFIISHHADELAIPSDCEMVVIKDKNGISRVK